jgi:hypothetical protein
MPPHRALHPLAAALLGGALLAAAPRPALAALADRVIEGEDRVSAPTSAGIAYGVLGLGLGLVILLFVDAAIRQRKLAAKARASVSKEPPLRKGHVVLSGVVAADDDQPPVRVTITQQGKEWSVKGGWAHSWTEIDRRVEVRPFRLVLPSGASVPVDAGDDVFLVDGLDRIVFLHGLRRTRTAELSVGEPAVVSGVLRSRSGGHAMATAYRGGGAQLVVRPPARGKLLVSTEPLEQRHLDRARHYRQWALAFSAFFAACQIVFAPYHLRNAFGQVAVGTVASKRHYTTHRKGGTTHHYELRVRVPDVGSGPDGMVTEDVPLSDYNAVSEGDAVRVVAERVVGFDGQLGERAGLHRVVAGLSILGGLVLAASCFRRLRAARPWYERRTIVDKGNGPIVRV